jgi:squalene-hopene/tetraprenyl-beta-curcumene cyclase
MMRNLSGLFVAAVFGIATARPSCGEESAERPPQYSFEQITVAGARADEPRLPELSIGKAAEYLDQGAVAWSGSRNCVSCHTNGAWLTVRPLLNEHLGPANPALREFAVAQLRQMQSLSRDELAKSTNPAQVIYITAGLAEWDAHTGGSLSPEAAESLKLMFEVQLESGTWGSLDCWPPYESDAFHLATVALTAVAAAPGGEQALDAAGLAAKVDRLKSYLRETPPPHDYSRVLLLGAASRSPGLLEAQRTGELVAMIESKQHADGGWSIRDFAQPEQWGGGNRAAKLRGEPEFVEPPSDGHMTGLAVVVLRSAGVDKSDPRIQKGIAWLKANQRESGRWWTRSLNTDTQHYITYSGTAFPLLALALCEELPKSSAGSASR